MSKTRPMIPLLVVLVAAIAALVAVSAADDDPTASRQSEVAARGAQVMPFDLDKTTHRFKPTGGGGVQAVVAKDRADHEQIADIRRHLRKEASAFARGDLSDPAAIHGEGMPGLEELEANADALAVRYSERPDGAEVHFKSSDPKVVDALHQWFDAQVSDHGKHAEHAS